MTETVEDQPLEAGGIAVARATYDAAPERYHAMARALTATRITVCEGDERVSTVQVVGCASTACQAMPGRMCAKCMTALTATTAADAFVAVPAPEVPVCPGVCADCGGPGDPGDGLRIKRRGGSWAWICLDDEACELRDTVRDLRAELETLRRDRDQISLDATRARVDAHEAFTAMRVCVAAADAFLGWTRETGDLYTDDGEWRDTEGGRLADAYNAARSTDGPAGFWVALGVSPLVDAALTRFRTDWQGLAPIVRADEARDLLQYLHGGDYWYDPHLTVIGKLMIELLSDACAEARAEMKR